MTRRLDNPESCFVCRRRADGIGTGGTQEGRRIGWLCRECADIGAKAYAMPARAWDEYETRALATAGAVAGAYLERIGQTDLARLYPETWAEFLRVALDAFGSAIRREVFRGAVRDGFGAVVIAPGDEQSEIEDAA
jgi:hypothetical protein